MIRKQLAAVCWQHMAILMMMVAVMEIGMMKKKTAAADMEEAVACRIEFVAAVVMD